MKLPAVRQTSTATPVSIPSATPIHQSSYLMVTSLTLPLLSPSTLSLTVNQSIPRLDPLHPPLVRKRTVWLETPTVHHHNHQRTLLMQRKEYFKYHQVWRKPFYGTSTEREEYRKELREHLKRQIEEKRAGQSMQLASKAAEAEFLREVDCLALSNEREKRVHHSKEMTHYRDENKRLMEQRWRDRVLTRSLEAMREKELLHLNPINWSGTLK
ncbi:uncharacterized protein [Osmerus mordax]|uniref:uncharacterized protein n=1 Tax=Osmerus mordax TaxID=8014 RepID=UPI00350F31F8